MGDSSPLSWWRIHSHFYGIDASNLTWNFLIYHLKCKMQDNLIKGPDTEKQELYSCYIFCVFREANIECSLSRGR